MSYSLVSIVPVAHVGAINALGAAIGRSDSEYSVLLSATGAAPATHCGLRTWASAATRAQFEALHSNPSLAPAVEGYGSAQVQAAILATSLDWRADSPEVASVHWSDALATQGLLVIDSHG